MPTPPKCQVVRLGLLEYLMAWELQKSLAWQVHHWTQPNTLLLLEHLPVYTIGRRGTRDQILLDDRRLSEEGISLHETDRGGQATFHGPGQLVAYPVLDLRNWGGPVKYVRTLEQVIVKTLADFGINASLIEGWTGVWVEGENACLERSRKIAAIGVKISRGVSYHGLALNVNTDLTRFDHIVPCGITDRGVTSMQKAIGRPVDTDVVAYSLAYHFGREMGFRMVEVDSLPQDMAISEPTVVPG